MTRPLLLALVLSQHPAPVLYVESAKTAEALLTVLDSGPCQLDGRVTICADGTVLHAAPPTEAARDFWRAVEVAGRARAGRERLALLKVRRLAEEHAAAHDLFTVGPPAEGSVWRELWDAAEEGLK